jgi:hypothetical protein
LPRQPTTRRSQGNWSDRSAFLHRLTLTLACSLICLAPFRAIADASSVQADLGDVALLGTTAPPRADYSRFIARALAAEETDAAQAATYPWRGPAPAQPDLAGVRRDTYYFLGYQFVVIGILYVAPESISGWDEETKDKYSLDKWIENVTNPVVRDGDDWWINYILHPYWGGTYYIRGRERGLDETQSFLFSALLSTLYEYGAEALFEPVSIEDLIITPLVGSLVGEYLFAPLRDYVRSKPGELGWGDKAILVATDPLGVVNSATDRLFGVKTSLQWQPIGTPRSALATVPGVPASALRNYDPAWGLQLRVEW